MAGDVGAAIREIKARTGWTWREVGEHLGTTGEYARKLATKPTSSGAGRALVSNVADFQRTGAAQPPRQRPQRVRRPGGAPSAPAPVRTAPSARRAFKVERSVFRGEGRDGWAVQVTVPKRATASGDRLDAQNAIADAVRRAAQGRRRVQFRVTVRDASGEQWTVDLGSRGGYDSHRALRQLGRFGSDVFSWLVDQGLDRYGQRAGVDVLESEIVAVEVVGMP